MNKINIEVIEESAKNLMFELNPGQAELIVSEFDAILTQINYLKDIPGIDDVEPMTFPYKLHRSDEDLREDKIEEPLKVEQVLENSNSKLGNQIKVPKVVVYGVDIEKE